MTRRTLTECISWRWKGNLGDDLIWAAQEAMFGHALELGQYLETPEAVLVGGGTFVPKAPENPQLLDLSRRLPTAFFATGVGDPVFWGTTYVAEWLDIIANARFVGVRGPLSEARLREWGARNDALQWIGDAALYFATDELVASTKGHVAVNVGTTYNQLYADSDAALIKAVGTACKQLVRDGCEITLVSAWEPDDPFLEEIARTVPVRGFERWHDNFTWALELISQFDVVVSEKLHVSVAAACRNVPFVALNYRSKVLDFCKSIEWTDACVHTDALDPHQIVEHVRALLRDRLRFATTLRQKVARARKRLVSAIPQAVEALTDQL